MKDISFRTDKHEIDWVMLKQVLAQDAFDNGRSPEQYRDSFQNSYQYCIAYHYSVIIGTARVLSDGICNAYVVDVWTATPWRKQGIGRRMIHLLLSGLTGQHVYLFTDEAIRFYKQCGFQLQPYGMGLVAGKWLQKETACD